MLYKGGPKYYSKGDWMVIKAIVGIVVVASIVAKIADPGSSGPESASTSVAASSEFVDAAKRAGYSDSDADQVAAAAERLCIARSEEHTSELQSLMRISYAVFYLKKKTQSSSLTITPTLTQPPTHTHNSTIPTHIRHNQHN